MARRCFYSFHYKPDNQRASQVRNIGAIEGNAPVSDNAWESITSLGDSAIRRWIDGQMNGRSCTVVLVGTGTADRKWINHEIIESWNKGMGVAGIRIHGLKNLAGLTSARGANPFDYISYENGRTRLSSIVRCYNPSGYDSRSRYDWIKQNIANVVEEAISIRKAN